LLGYPGRLLFLLLWGRVGTDDLEGLGWRAREEGLLGNLDLESQKLLKVTQRGLDLGWRYLVERHRGGILLAEVDEES
jgi:hypothetical protein